MPTFSKYPAVPESCVILMCLSGDDDQFRSFKLPALSSGQHLLLTNEPKTAGGDTSSDWNAYRLEQVGSGDDTVEIKAELDRLNEGEGTLWDKQEVTWSFQKLTVGQPFPLISFQRCIQKCLSSRSSKVSRTTNRVRINLTVRETLGAEKTNQKQNQVNKQDHLTFLGSLLTSGSFSDCKIVTADGDHIDSHKFLLSVKSEVIRKAFQSEQMEEAKRNQFPMEFSAQVVRLILPHFYTGEIGQISRETAIDAYKLAHLYEMDGLKTYLADEMLRLQGELIDVQNILEFLVFTDTYELAGLFRTCGIFLRRNSADVGKLAEWDSFCLEHNKILGKLVLMRA